MDYTVIFSFTVNGPAEGRDIELAQVFAMDPVQAVRRLTEELQMLRGERGTIAIVAVLPFWREPEQIDAIVDHWISPKTSLTLYPITITRL